MIKTYGLFIYNGLRLAILYETLIQVRDLENSVEEIQEKIWELDKSWKNNLVFYGIRSDTLEEHPSVTESKIREIIARQMYITREIPIARCRRTNKVLIDNIFLIYYRILSKKNVYVVKFDHYFHS